MRDSLKRLIEETGGVVLLDGTLIQFGEQAFERMFQLVYEAGMESALAAATKQLDNLSES
jgi:hypothetical protein